MKTVSIDIDISTCGHGAPCLMVIGYDKDCEVTFCRDGIDPENEAQIIAEYRGKYPDARIRLDTGGRAGEGYQQKLYTDL